MENPVPLQKYGIEGLYDKIKSMNSNWNVSFNGDIIDIKQNNDVLFRIYKNVGSAHTFFLFIDGMTQSPLFEFQIIDFLSKCA